MHYLLNHALFILNRKKYLLNHALLLNRALLNLLNYKNYLLSHALFSKPCQNLILTQMAPHTCMHGYCICTSNVVTSKEALALRVLYLCSKNQQHKSSSEQQWAINSIL